MRGIFINRVAAGIATVAVAACSVQANVTFLANAVIMGIAQTFMILISMYYGEGNRKAMKRVVKVACYFELFLTGLLSVVLFIFAPFAAKLYLGGNVEALEAGVISLRWFAVGLLFQGYCILFTDYLQVTGRVFLANLVYVIDDILFTVAAVVILAGRFGMHGLFAGMAAAYILMFLFILVLILIRSKDPDRDLLMLDEGFGVTPENEYSATVTDRDGTVTVSADLIEFCLSKGIERRIAGNLGLAAEEMVINVIEHGFTDGKPHYIDVRAIYKQEDGVTLIVRDDCRPFDPKERFKYLTTDDPTANIGLRLVMNLAKDVSYTSTLNLNNLTIKI